MPTLTEDILYNIELHRIMNSTKPGDIKRDAEKVAETTFNLYTAFKLKGFSYDKAFELTKIIIKGGLK